jgi:glycosyltransferase involved in cell wall biosynthesis
LLKVIQINTRDIIGGAAIAASRIHRGLINCGIQSIMLVDIKASLDDPTIERLSHGLSSKMRSRIDYFLLRFLKNKARSISWFRSKIIRRIIEVNPDVVHLHWVNNGFLAIEQIAQINCPVVWTLHDMWAFSDSRHYVSEEESPTYRSELWIDRWVWNRKKRTYSKLKNLTIVTPSNWLAECARNSVLLKGRNVHVIANGIDTDMYSPKDKNLLRERYQVKKSPYMILFSGYDGVRDARKGFHHLTTAISLVKNVLPENVSLGVIGSNGPTDLDELGFKTYYFGNIKDQEVMRDLYALSDLFVLPSTQDNLPNTVIEAMACGCPTIAFNVGGIPDLVDHLDNGYLAELYNEEDFAKGIMWYFESDDKAILSQRAREKVLKNFNIKIQAKKYIDLYSTVKQHVR